ncbi:MAG: exodeoxyribonuclease VII large subunit [Patescibacteria group bacterium]|nr:exodeoxyribonuclease VII large subunit [Patescibacteria group bacterium]
MRKQELLFGPGERKAARPAKIAVKTEQEEKEPAPPKIFSVSEFIALLNARLKEIEARITGEISKVSCPPSGHVYFSLKDEKNESVIDAVMWRSQYENCGIKLEAGMRVVALGHADIYAPTGRLAFKARAIELTGEGILKKRYEELKRKLAAEGVFDPARKRPIPDYPQRIGVITSRNGAVIHDILNNLGQFGYKVILADARVEGPEAVGSLLRAIGDLRPAKLDVLVIARGGGSMEALQAFDNEKLVRAILDFPVPVVAGIGHHQDVPLAALAADAHASTPTAVANLLNRSWSEASFRLAHESGRIISIYRNIIAGAAGALDPGFYLERFRRMHENLRRTFSNFGAELPELFGRILVKSKTDLNLLQRVIAANDPARNLRLGYSIARRHGKVLKSAAGLSAGDDFDLQLSDGTIHAAVRRSSEGGGPRLEIKPEA